MPIYEYECEKCHKISEALQHFSDQPLIVCEQCGGNLHKLISKSSFHLKGGGWYSDGYSSPGGSGTAPKNSKPKTAPKKDSSCPKETKGSTCCAQGSPCKCAA